MTGRIYTRGEWGARQRAGFGSRRIGALDKSLHHSVTVPPADNLAAEFAAMRALEQIGQARFGGGVSYTFAVAPSGRVFEGTGVSRIGAHTAGRNTKTAGIVLLGNYQETPPPAPMLDGLVWLLQHGVRAGYWQLPTITFGHRQTSSTSCPGNRAFALIPEINARGRGEAVPSATPVSNPLPGVDGRPKNADGSLQLTLDGIRGAATIGRWQEVMGTPIDWGITPPPVGSTLIRADQRFLNSVIPADHLANLDPVGRRGMLDEDGIEGGHTIGARQFWLYNVHGPAYLGRPARASDFDRIAGPETTRLHQYALNRATAGSGRY
jgi:hypothetical protein